MFSVLPSEYVVISLIQISLIAPRLMAFEIQNKNENEENRENEAFIVKNRDQFIYFEHITK